MEVSIWNSLLVFSLSRSRRDSLEGQSVHREDGHPFFRNVGEGGVKRIELNLECLFGMFL